MLRMTLTGAALAVLWIAAFPGSAQAGSIEFGELHGTKWWDLNGDGQLDAGEPGLPDWTIQLTDSTGFVVETTSPTPMATIGSRTWSPEPGKSARCCSPAGFKPFPPATVRTL